MTADTSIYVSFLLFLLMFGMLVISHESGHFLIARANSIRVNEFTIGLGPVLFQKKRGDTMFSVRLLPFGGACIYEGMFADDEPLEDADLPPGTISFREAPVYAKMATILAGPAFNVLLAYILSLVVNSFSVWNFPVIRTFVDNSAAYEAGLREGDKIVKWNNESIHMAQEVILNSSLNNGESVRIVYERDGSRQETVITPTYSEEDKRYYMGFTMGDYRRLNGAELISHAWYDVQFAIKGTYKSLLMLIKGELDKDDVSGPVGMVKMVDDTYEEVRPYGLSAVVLTMMNLCVLLSVNIAVINLLPLPALDGGRLLFLIIEAIRGKPIPPDKEGFVHLVGMVCLLVLMVLIMFNDISKFLH